jgi:hypothetical protein
MPASRTAETGWIHCLVLRGAPGTARASSLRKTELNLFFFSLSSTEFSEAAAGSNLADAYKSRGPRGEKMSVIRKGEMSLLPGHSKSEKMMLLFLCWFADKILLDPFSYSNFVSASRIRDENNVALLTGLQLQVYNIIHVVVKNSSKISYSEPVTQWLRIRREQSSHPNRVRIMLQ